MTIKELRESRKLSQAALAQELGLNVSAIGHMEHGRMNVSAKIAAKVKELYGVELDGATWKREPEIIIQSPMGGEITTEQVIAKLPAGADCVFVRVDQNKLWWIRGEDTGNVDIWE